MRLTTPLALVCLGMIAASAAADTAVHVRANQIGYLPGEEKIAVAFSNAAVTGTFSLIDDGREQAAFTGKIAESPASGWGKFAHYYGLDFSRFDVPGRYRLRIDATGELSRPFTIGETAYRDFHEELLRFLRQQRCGYNPLLNCVCHQRDGRTAYGPLAPGTFVDARGGWHDAGDQLKYLMTTSAATGQMLLAFELEPTKFDDRVDQQGHPQPNGVPDVLDEARWGLEWILKLHPEPTHLYHQVADDRDHLGWKMPDQDKSDYGWGPNSYRVVYFADGKPQGLRKYQSQATGVANLAGRCAAALAAAHRIWTRDLHEPEFAAKCLRAAEELYAMGRAQEGYQQGNSYGAPYRYNEKTWADDMEWAAAELFRQTSKPDYLNDAVRYARLAADTSWMPLETVGHYEYYPFINLGHFALYPHADAETRAQLAGYYRTGIDATLQRARGNAFRVGVPFIWCSNNLATALIWQVFLYERMTGDHRYHGHMLAQRDWLFGCNPWGSTMFTGIPRDGEYPEDVHTSTWALTRRAVAGGLVDGPVYAKVFSNLAGLHLTRPDPFAAFQTDHVVYHDDIGDYSTNEPTMDGTAGAVWMMAHFGATPQQARTHAAQSLPKPSPSFLIDAGGIRRGPRERKQLAILFTVDMETEDADSILKTLQAGEARASFFASGSVLASADMRRWIRRAIAAGHYVGPYSHSARLYARWEDRQKSAWTKPQFQADLHYNLAELRDFGVSAREPAYLVPPLDWYNADHVDWARELGCQIVGSTPRDGSRSTFTRARPQEMRLSREVVQRILDDEARAGLSGHLLVFPLGSAPKDEALSQLSHLIEQLRQRGYALVRIDALLR